MFDHFPDFPVHETPHRLTGAGLPVVAGVQAARHVQRTPGRHLGSEPGPLQFGFLVQVALAFTDVEEWVAVATAGLEGAERHRHGAIQVYVQDTETRRL